METSIFKQFNKVVAHKTLQQIIFEIKNGEVQNEINLLRKLIAEGNTKGYDEQKKSLLAFTPSGKFSGGRTAKHLTQYTAKIILDIDDLPPVLLHQAKEYATQSPYTLACFISPSGEGLKIIVATNATLETHKQTFIALQQYYEKLLNLFIDDSGKDPTRLCFYSFDAETYSNENATIFNPQNLLPMQNEIEIKDPAATFEHCKRYTDKKKTYSEGGRNAYIHFLANNCNRKGLTEEQTFQFASANFDLDKQEIKIAVASAYKNISEHNTNQYDDEKPKPPAIDVVENFLSARYEFRTNVITGKLEYKKLADEKFQTISDYKENSLLRELLKAKIKCNQSNLRGILGSDFCKPFNPFINYFENLPEWDNSTDHIKLLANTVTTTNQPFWENCFRRWIVAMVGSAITDNITNHTVIVFSGGQGKGKTTWLNNLVPKQLSEYSFTGLVHPNNKDTLAHLVECLIINLDELETLNKSEIGSLKQIITQANVRIRRAYGHHNESLVRRASFVGSVNNSQFLNDPTGSRRFLCFETLNIEYQHGIELNQVYAQALHLLKDGFQYWFSKDEIEIINANNEQYQQKQMEEEALLTWFKKPTSEAATIHLTTAQILTKLSEKAKLPITNAAQNALGKMLRKHNFLRVKKRDIYVYAVEEISYEEVEAKTKEEIEITTPNSDVNADDLPF